MKINWVICLLSGIWLAGCSPNDPAPNEDVNALYQRFHGKYKPVNSVASEPVDVNLDGKRSDNLFLEYNYLEEHTLEIYILGPSKYRSANSFHFVQFWPEQYVRTGFSTQWNGEPLDYSSSYFADFAQQGSTRQFSFSTDVKRISVQPNENENSFRGGRPESVTVEANGRLRVVNKRKLFTTTGVKEVVITTVYERYTMST